MKKLTDNIYVSGQICADDLEAIAAAGIQTIINNRPDGEMMGQTPGDDIMQAAENLGLAYHAIPIAGGFTMDQVSGLRDILDGTDAPVLAYCGSGTRSSILWALAQAGTMETDDILKTAADAGYDLRQYAPMIESVAGA